MMVATEEEEGWEDRN